MTRQEYLAELNTHLMSLSAEERENAVRFYEEYFEDAGADKEQAVIEELGKPYALAKSIICEQSEYSKSKSYAKYRESKGLGPADTEMPKGDPDVMPNARPHTQHTAYNYSYENGQNNAAQNGVQDASANGYYDRSYENYKENYKASSSSGSTYSSSGGDNTAMLITGLILGIIFGVPALIGLIFAIIGVALAAVVSALASVILLIVGVVGVFTTGGAGMILVGIGIACAGIGFLLVIPSILGFGKLLPWIFRMIGRFFKKFAKEVK